MSEYDLHTQGAPLPDGLRRCATCGAHCDHNDARRCGLNGSRWKPVAALLVPAKANEQGKDDGKEQR